MENAIQILMVEDDPADVELTRESLEQSKLELNMTVVHDGGEALDYLYRCGPYRNAARPDLILLDLNLPGKNGRDVLDNIKRDKDMKGIPVVVLTTSRSQADVADLYRLGCNCYVQKPLGLEEFNQVIQSIENFWLTVVRLPS